MAAGGGVTWSESPVLIGGCAFGASVDRVKQ